MRASAYLVLAVVAVWVCAGLSVDAAGAPSAHRLKQKTLPADIPPNTPHLHQRPTRLFPTRAATHTEPVLNYRVRHEDNQHLHSLETLHPSSQHPLKVGNAVNSIGAHSLKMRWRDGLKQPFPNSIHVAFRAFDQDFVFHNMQLDVKLYAKDAKMEVHGADGTIERLAHSHNTYITSVEVESLTGVESSGWAICTLGEDGLLTATINMGDETYQVNPLFVHAHEFEDDEVFASLKTHAIHNLVITRHSDMTHLKNGGHQCGAAKPRPVHGPSTTITGDPLTDGDIDWSTVESKSHVIHLPPSNDEHASEDAAEGEEDATLIAGSRRRLLNYAPGYGITRYTNCYTGDSTAHKLSLGVTVDRGYFAIYGTAQNVANSISNVLAATNAVYVAQFDLFLELQNTIVKAAADTTTWNLAPDTPGGRCSATTINALLDSLTAWRSTTMPQSMSIWHHFTACYPAPGTVGLAWVGVLCSSSYGTGVSSWTGSLWLTTAHEIGHNTNAQHAFEEGQGTTGGIMDYGDGTYPLNSGIYQFNPKYAQADQCKHFAATVTQTGITPYCWASYAPVCGNGVVEPGEQCDDSSSCCSKTTCQLTGACTQAFGNTGCCNAACQYTSTATRCNNNLGYCGNGVCVDAVCTSYGLPFCQVESPNCKVQCGGGTSGYACSSSWTAPNCNIASGLVCNNSPFSTCDGAGACSAIPQPVTYSWSTGGFSACACAGTQTRTVTCQTSAGATAADSMCTGTKPSTTGACTAPSTCYQWQQSAFSTCSVNCGTGSQTATVTCVQSASGVTPGAQVTDTYCTASKPVTQQTCTPGTCPTAWVSSAFGSCTQSCGIGVQSRTVTCMQTQNGAQTSVGDSFCTSTKPLTTQACNTTPCINGHWVYSSWGACTQDCGSGTQTRTQSCADATGAAAVATRCASANSDPLSQACNTTPCPNYHWVAGAFGTCSLTCGGGTQTRAVNCYDQVNDPSYTTPSNTNFCTLTQPSTIQTCNTQACPIPPNYQWSIGAYGACMSGATVVTCGGAATTPAATATRTVQCINTVDSSVQADSACSAAGAKPVTSQACSQQGCPTYSWSASGFTACSKLCGSGTQDQSVACKQDGTSNQVADSLCLATKPPTQQACNTNPCTTAPVWQAGSPSACSAVCGGGIQTYTPQCYTDTTPVDASACSSLVKPATSTACNTGKCPTLWYSTPFGPCSESCGPTGVQTRQVGCFYSTDDPTTASAQPDSYCTTSKPASQSSCNSNPCPTWQYSSDWSDCSVACNLGLQSRNVTCQNFDGTAALPAACVNAVAPVVSRTCMVEPCPHWHRGLWGDCNKPCADSIGPGQQNRSVLCLMPHDDPLYFGISALDWSLCPKPGEGDTGDGDGQPGVANGKPPARQACNTDACPAHYWLQSNPSACSASCGTGVRTSTVVCISALTGVAGSPNLCLAEQPPSSYPCNTFACPNYAWATTAWSDCSAVCGSGNQTRKVSCRNSVPDPSVHFQFIDVDDAFCLAAQPKPATSQVCTQPDDTCWGSQYSTGGVKNGRCDQTSKTCVCRTGFSGDFCQDNLGIHNVRTNSDLFGTAGVPFSESLSITWNSSTAIYPYVSIVLLRLSAANVWPVGQYLATLIPNTNSWSWSVGSILQSGLEAGDGYQVRVWYSKSNGFADSDLFSVADPCGYVNCGQHGTCARGICTCSPGYSGQFCAQGPCERALCDTTANTCTNDALVTSGAYLNSQVCPCSSGWTGAQCRTPTMCASIVCQHGGDLGSVVQTASSCTGQCVCRGNWVGPTCSTCGLTCQHGGVANGNCTACDSCAAGYFGADCSCQYYLLGFQFLADVSGWFGSAGNAVAQARWSRTLALDIITAVASVSPNKASVVVDSIKPQPASATDTKASVLVSVKLSLDCATIAPFGGGGEEAAYHFDYSTYEPVSGRRYDPSAFQAFVSRHLLGMSSNSTLLSTYNSYLPLLSDLDSMAFQGQLTSLADPTFRVTAVDPSGADALTAPGQPRDCFQVDCTAQPTPPDNDRSTRSVLFIALFCVGSVLVVLGVSVGVYYCWRWKRSSTDATSHLSKLGESEMTANPALSGGRWNNI